MPASKRFCKTFCLIKNDGTELYPVRIKSRTSGRLAFNLSEGGANGNKRENVIYEENESALFNLVVNEGLAVRASALNGRSPGLYKVNQRAVHSFKRCLTVGS